jgi:outer membrane immunogenic protein
MSLKSLCLSAIAIGTLPLSVFAADLSAPAAGNAAEPAASSVHAWDGVYLGAFVEGLKGSDHWYGSVYDHGTEEFEGWLGGARVGIGAQVASALYVGASADVAAVSAPYRHELPAGSYDDVNPTYQATADIRAGFALDSVLLYGSVGVAALAMDSEFFKPADQTDAHNNIAYGWLAGAGFEVALTENVSIYGEYRTYQFNPVTRLSLWDPSIESNEIAYQSVKVGINYRLN